MPLLGGAVDILLLCVLALGVPLAALRSRAASSGRQLAPEPFLLAAGPILAIGWAWHTQGASGRPDRAETGSLLPRPVRSPAQTQSHWAFTDSGRRVSLLRFLGQEQPSHSLAEEDAWLRRRGLSGQVIRTAPPSSRYVCHDWVFTGGRYSKADPTSVEEILADNGYRPVGAHRAGDLAVYRNRTTGIIMHTGVVQLAGEGVPTVVESKWSWCGRYLHLASVYFHPEAACTFYRSPRSGHLLLGVETGGGKGPQLLALPPPRTHDEAGAAVVPR